MRQPRRHFIRNSATLAAAWSLFPQLRAASSASAPPAHPRLFLAAKSSPGLQSVDDFRHAIKSGGFLGEAWSELIAQADAEAKLPALQVDSIVPERPMSMVRDKNPDYYICYHTGARMNRFALAHLVTGKAVYLKAAKSQLSALLDPDQWPDWIDQAHIRFGHPADLRTGMLSQDCAIAYDWLYDSLTETERAEIRDGIDRRGIQPFLTSVEQKAWWMEDLNNWVTVIAGGVAVAAMAMREHHPEAQSIIDIATERFNAYLETYGPDGEFNESVAYAGANRLPVQYFNALRFATGGEVDRLGEWPFPQMCRWVMHGTLDDKKLIPFGDSWPERDVMTGYVAAVAAANQDPVLQDYFLRTLSEKHAHPMNLLFYDARVKPLPPTGREPLAIAFPAHGGMIVSRTSWEKPKTDCIVFSKFSREENHEHNDLGVVGFDTLGERMIVDLGSPSGYPEDFFEGATRWKYYNASIRGHNTLMFGGREQRFPQRKRGEPILTKAISGKLLDWWHEEGQGTAWRMELAPAYTGVKTFTRTVLHLWPGYILVLDDAELDQSEEISLRWHTIDQAEPETDGSFVVRKGGAATTGRIANLGGGTLSITRKQHRYVAPYDRDRTGDPLEKREESFLDATLTGNHCRLLTLFATGAVADFGGGDRWSKTPTGWTLYGPHGPVSASISRSKVSLQAPQIGRKVELKI
ncbi:MAG: hypothetical protein SynsKO_13940 [Synoicihabitans sp.]